MKHKITFSLEIETPMELADYVEVKGSVLDRTYDFLYANKGGELVDFNWESTVEGKAVVS